MAHSQPLYSPVPAPSREDDIYNASPQQTGVTQPGPAMPRAEDEQQQRQKDPAHLDDPLDGQDEKAPVLPTRPGPAMTRSEDKQQQQRQSDQSHPEDLLDDEDEKAPPLPPRRSSSSLTYHRSKEHAMAYMVPLPPPLDAKGQQVKVPQRFMLYLPPAPDRLKPLPDSDNKERKRDKAVRRWQGEVRKAKTTTKPKSTFSGLYLASVRGAVFCLAKLQRSELTFLSRLPRHTLTELTFLHTDEEAMTLSGRRRFELVKEEFYRNKHVAKRDFWIGAAVLPFAQGVDIAIPVFGGFSEVTLVWMIITGTAWKTASGMMNRLVYKDGDVDMRSLTNDEQQQQQLQQRQTGSLGSSGSANRAVVKRKPVNGAGGNDNGNSNGNDNGNSYNSDGSDGKDDKDSRKAKKPWWKKKEKAPKPPVETVFRASAALDTLSRYVEATCHARNAAFFPDVGEAGTELEVLTSLGWAPVQRGEQLAGEEEREADVAWQIRQATEDLRLAVQKAAKTWDKFCEKYVENPEKALRDEQKELEKKARKEEKERLKRAEKAERTRPGDRWA